MVADADAAAAEAEAVAAAAAVEEEEGWLWDAGVKTREVWGRLKSSNTSASRGWWK